MNNIDKEKKAYVTPSVEIVVLDCQSRLLGSSLEELGQIAPVKDYQA